MMLGQKQKPGTHAQEAMEGPGFEWVFNPQVQASPELIAFLNQHASARITENLGMRHMLEYHGFSGKTYVFKRFSPSDNKKTSRKIELSLKSYLISGAQRSFRGASWLAQAGIPTVRPIAWASRGKGYRQVSYFIYERLECEGTLQEAVDRGREPPAVQSRLIEKMAEVTRAMHDAGLRHTDIVTHNFLYAREGDAFRIYLIDTDKVARPWIWTRSSTLKDFIDLRCLRRMKLPQEHALPFFNRYFNGQLRNAHLSAWKFWLLGGFNPMKRIKLRKRGDKDIERLKKLTVS